MNPDTESPPENKTYMHDAICCRATVLLCDGSVESEVTHGEKKFR